MKRKISLRMKRLEAKRLPSRRVMILDAGGARARHSRDVAMMFHRTRREAASRVCRRADDPERMLIGGGGGGQEVEMRDDKVGEGQGGAKPDVSVPPCRRIVRKAGS
ncbi:hypothetical protein CTAM01_16584 [Colletotrichum tamarilloi]|uniref:Uncharacterized protein n=1 Tax=Colletotrichum tamarilloi TaxID=1209934 RepID=A0ABQ9QI50_9PEZI|nr:uncharacterized protein CTAM01_16584 [Colletotrichum tamarilloi]KAK1471292.1 hypothetical protein CTAM01_16584 [Colletotrichum tamarilloi]